MCPLRLILIFLSATLAGFFVIRNLKTQTEQQLDDDGEDLAGENASDSSSSSCFSKIGATVKSGVWTCVDMASGRYLWRHLAASSSKRSS